MLLFLKDLFKEIRISFSRFFAILLINALGVCIFSGILAIGPNMRNNADSYLDNYKTASFKIISNFGFTNNEIDDFRKIEKINLLASHSYDLFVKINNQSIETRVISFNPNANVNKLILISGRYPKNAKEILLDDYYAKFLNLNDKIIIDDSNAIDLFNNQELTIVGFIKDPSLFTYNRDLSNIGSGRIKTYLYADISNFKSKYFNQLSIEFDDLLRLNRFNQKYLDLLNKKEKELESFKENHFSDYLFNRSKEYDNKLDELNEKKTQVLRLKEFLSYALDSKIPFEYLNLSIKENEYNYEYLNQLEDNLLKIDDSIKGLTEARNDLRHAKWYLLSNNSNYAYQAFKSASERMDAIAYIFPIFFLIVSALVSLSSLKRLIDEKRLIIGTYKALGFTNSYVVYKYLSFAIIASFIGSFLGSLIGMRLFPYLIYNNWLKLFDLPKLNFSILVNIRLFSILTSLITVSIVVYYSVKSELKEKPASLLRNKNLNSSKAIYLERINLIWRRLTNMQRVVLRNLFRYKKKFLMSLIGVAGSFALLIAAFGIKDSISNIPKKQFEEIVKYRYIINLKEAENDELNHLLKKLHDYQINDYYILYKDIHTFDNHNINIFFFDDVNKLNDYYNFGFEIKDQEVIISSKIAKDLKLKIGDDYYYNEHHYKITKIYDNYYDHYLFINDENKNLKANTILIKDNNIEEALINELASEKIVNYISDHNVLKENLSSNINNINFIVILLIICSMFLLFIIMFNLSIINISERTKEIASFKVLGFLKKEVNAYIVNENLILVSFANILGIFLGKLLHYTIMNFVEIDNLAFLRRIDLKSYLYSFILSYLFIFVVNSYVKHRIKNIKMVESLKSIE